MAKIEIFVQKKQKNSEIKNKTSRNRVDERGPNISLKKKIGTFGSCDKYTYGGQGFWLCSEASPADSAQRTTATPLSHGSQTSFQVTLVTTTSVIVFGRTPRKYTKILGITLTLETNIFEFLVVNNAISGKQTPRPRP